MIAVRHVVSLRHRTVVFRDLTVPNWRVCECGGRRGVVRRSAPEVALIQTAAQWPGAGASAFKSAPPQRWLPATRPGTRPAAAPRHARVASRPPLAPALARASERQVTCGSTARRRRTGCLTTSRNQRWQLSTYVSHNLG